MGVLVMLFGMCTVWAQSTQSVSDLFDQAQRLHLGVDQPPDYRKAFGLYQEIIKRNSRHKDAFYNMAHISFAQKRYDLAAKYYQQVLRIDPGDRDAQNNLATVYFKQGKVDRAKTEYLRIVRAHRDFGRAYYNLAIIYLQEDNKIKAEKVLEEALRIEPENPEYVRMYAQLKGDAGPVTAGTALAVVSGFAGIVVGYYLLFGRKGV